MSRASVYSWVCLEVVANICSDKRACDALDTVSVADGGSGFSQGEELSLTTLRSLSYGLESHAQTSGFSYYCLNNVLVYPF